MRVPWTVLLTALFVCNTKKEVHELIVGMNAPLFFLTSAKVFSPGHLKSVVS